MTVFEFVEQLSEIIAGEDGYYNYDKQEILDLAKQMKTSAEEYQNELDCKDAAEVHELMNPAVCDVWTNQNYTSGYSITTAHLNGKQLIVKWLQHQQL